MNKHKPPLPPRVLGLARHLRRGSTDAENLMWRLVRDRQLDGHKFRRQHPVGKYIADFYCHDARLTIELDGGGHADTKQAAHDHEREQAFTTAGIRILRFWNHDVLKRTEAVLQEIWDALCASPSP